MKVITSNPVYVNKIRVAGEQDWLYVDGSSDKATILAFQKYANSKGWSPKLVEDGKWGAKTQAAAGIWGITFDSGTTSVIPSVAPPVIPSVVPLVVPPGATPTVTQVAEAKKKGFTWDALAGGFVKAKESGLLDTVLGLFGKGSATPPVSTAAPYIPVTTPVEEKPKMSTGVKIALIGGGVLVVGVLIFALTRKK